MDDLRLWTYPVTGRLTIHEGTREAPTRPAAFDLDHIDDVVPIDVEVTLTPVELIGGRYILILSEDGITADGPSPDVLACGPIVDAYPD